MHGSVMLLAAHQPSVRAATVSFQPASFNRSSLVPFHHVHSHAHCFRALHPALHTKQNLQDAQSLSQTRLMFTWLHYTASSLFHFSRPSPPAALFYFARRQPHLGCVHLAAAIAHSSLISQSIAKVHLHSSAPFVPCGKYTTGASYGAGIRLHSLH